MDATYAVVLAAGKGTRMKSDLAKVLHELDGRPLIEHVLATLKKLEVEDTVLIVGHQADRVAGAARDYGVSVAMQHEQLGTGHAVLQASPALQAHDGITLVLCGDVPLLRASTLEKLVQTMRSANAAAAVLSAIAEDATGYGRILRDEDGRVVGIVEQKDASEAQREIREYNSGTYCFDNKMLWSALEQVGSDNAQGEFYLTDVVEILVKGGHTVVGVVCEDEREVQGINSPEDLARAHRDLQAMRDARGA